MLFYASLTRAYAPLKTPQGLSALVEAGALTAEEREQLLESSLGHDAVVGWLSVLFDGSVAAGLLGTSVARAGGTSPIAVQMSLQNKLIEARHCACCAERRWRKPPPVADFGRFGPGLRRLTRH